MPQTISGPDLGNVLVATDFSEDADLAVWRSALLPLSRGASLELLHVLPNETNTAVRARMDMLARQRLERLRSQASAMLADSGSRGRDVVVGLEHGKAFSEIARWAHAHDELIVVGRHGDRAFADVFVGTTAERLIRKADVSVLVVSSAAVRPYGTPLVAVDFSDSSRLAIELALKISDPELREIDVLHVLTPSVRHFDEASPLFDEDRRQQIEHEQRVATELVEFLAPFGNHVKWNLIVRNGDPRKRIIETAKHRGSDLLALGTHGRTGLAHAFLGSVAETILKNARTDVLVAKLPHYD